MRLRLGRWHWLAPCLLLSLHAALQAQPLTPATLQRLLQQAPQREVVRFREERESRWLATPVVSSGTLALSADALEKRVDVPKRETWRILADRIQLIRGDAQSVTELRFDHAPAVSALAHATRDAVAGDLQALERDFQLTLSGTTVRWTLAMRPRLAGVAQYLKEMELQGSRGRLQVILILDSQGDRTSTRLLDDD